MAFDSPIRPNKQQIEEWLVIAYVRSNGCEYEGFDEDVEWMDIYISYKGVRYTVELVSDETPNYKAWVEYLIYEGCEQLKGNCFGTVCV